MPALLFALIVRLTVDVCKIVRKRRASRRPVAMHRLRLCARSVCHQRTHCSFV